MRIHGFDFTSTPNENKQITRAVCRLDGSCLVVERINGLRTFEDFTHALEEPGPWTAAIDFPFGQPRGLVERLGWPQCWAEYVERVAAMNRQAFSTLFREDQDLQPEGRKRLRRETDRLAHSCSPMQLDFIPVAKMFFEGARRLLASPASIYPFYSRSRTAGVVVEGYPALVARRFARSYKSDNRRKWTELSREARRSIVAGIRGQSPDHSGQLVAVQAYGFLVQMNEEIATACIGDGTGDTVDSILCAMQAAWSYGQRGNGYGVPASADPLEGWIVDPSLLD